MVYRGIQKSTRKRYSLLKREFSSIFRLQQKIILHKILKPMIYLKNTKAKSKDLNPSKSGTSYSFLFLNNSITYHVLLE